MGKTYTWFALSLLALVVVIAASGCSSIDRMGGKMDMTINRLSEQGTHEYEGRLEAIAKVGVMTSLQLSGGKIYDVVDASPGLKPGDIIRIYHTEKGYEARLWKQAIFQPVLSQTVKPVHLPTSGS